MGTHSNCPVALRWQYIGPGSPHSFAPSCAHGAPRSPSACAGVARRTAIGAAAVTIAKPTNLSAPMIPTFLETSTTPPSNGSAADHRQHPCRSGQWSSVTEFGDALCPVPHRHVTGRILIADVCGLGDDALVVEENLHVVDPGERQRIAVVEVFGIVPAPLR